MMSGLFLLMSIALGSLFLGKRTLGISFLLVAVALSALMFWHHATDKLNINW